MVNKGWWLVVLLVMMLAGCMEINDQPDFYERTTSVSFLAKLDTTGAGSLIDEVPLLAHTPVTITTTAYADFEQTRITDENGWVVFDSLPSAFYTVTLKTDYDFQNEVGVMTLTGRDTMTVDNSGDIRVDTLMITMSGSKGLKINELYYMGPESRIFYYLDQFIELYNSSDDTLYLDGLVVCRVGICTIDVDHIISIFQFPGTPLTGREYPIAPGQFSVLAQDARQHILVQDGDTIVNSIDLSNADWEFVNSQDYGDSDNPDVPNIRNIEVGARTDFYIGMGSDIILIADGSDAVYSDGIDIKTVIDCVEFSTLSYHEKGITEELDRGFAGVGMTKYSFQSIERISKGFDTDNSTIDFKVYDYPTPGYQND